MRRSDKVTGNIVPAVDRKRRCSFFRLSPDAEHALNDVLNSARGENQKPRCHSIALAFHRHL